MLAVYQIVVAIGFVAALTVLIRSRDPFGLGALIGGFMLSGFDWLWCSRGFWNATTASGLLTVPALEIEGIRYPVSICFVWSLGFGMVPLLAARHYPAIKAALGLMRWPVLLAAGALIDLVVEGICVSGLGVWTYHQSPRYLIVGVPWSNSWFLGGLLAVSTVMLARTERWAALGDPRQLSVASEETWKGFLMAAATIWSAAFLLGCAQLFWWSAAQPWVEAGRPF